jgi:uncharacterized protein (TIGR02117 family)
MPINPMAAAPAFVFRILLGSVILLTAACSTANEGRYPSRHPDDAIRIFVVKHGWHTGVAVPKIGKQAPFTLLDPVFGDAAFYEFGWGDREYYRENDPGIWLALRAVLWPTRSVLHVVALPEPPPKSFLGAEMEELLVSKQGYQQLLNYLTEHFVLDEQSQPMAVGRGLYGDSRFFESHGSFHAFRTCNIWTAQALQHSGVPMRSFMALTAESVLSQVRDIMDDFMQEQKASAR